MSLASSQSQLLRGVAGANALGAKTETHGRRVSTLVRAGKAHDAKEHVPSKTDAPELEDSMAKKVMSGVAAAREIRKLMPDPDCPYIVAMTASAGSEDRLACLEAGMNDFIAKPTREARLRELFRETDE